MNIPRLFILVAGLAMGWGLSSMGYGTNTGLFWVCYAAYLAIAAIVWSLCPI
jgi:hypothetical protein